MEVKKGKLFLAISAKKKKKDEQSREKRHGEAKSVREVEVNIFTDNFLISGEEEICVKGRSERFQVKKLKNAWVYTVLYACPVTFLPQKPSKKNRVIL